MTLDEIVSSSRASQNKVELRKTLQYVSEIQPKVIVEIGVHKGYSMEVWNRAFQPEILIGIENDMHDIDTTALESPCVVKPMDSHKRETRDSLEIDLHGRPIDFLFLDGDHTYEGVKKDYELYQPFVRRGGIIAFHDVALGSNAWRMAGVDVQRFWNQVIAEPGRKYLFFWDEIGKGTGTGLYYLL